MIARDAVASQLEGIQIPAASCGCERQRVEGHPPCRGHRSTRAALAAPVVLNGKVVGTHAIERLIRISRLLTHPAQRQQRTDAFSSPCPRFHVPDCRHRRIRRLQAN
jgi:hypothetical protein